jgi:hypothetical protein
MINDLGEKDENGTLSILRQDNEENKKTVRISGRDSNLAHPLKRVRLVTDACNVLSWYRRMGRRK